MAGSPSAGAAQAWIARHPHAWAPLARIVQVSALKLNGSGSNARISADGNAVFDPQPEQADMRPRSTTRKARGRTRKRRSTSSGIA